MALDMDERMFFVIGAPRSGTTMLMRMLHAHPDIYTRPEPHLLTPLAHLGYSGYADFSGKTVRARLESGVMKDVQVSACNAQDCIVTSGLEEGEKLATVVEVRRG